VVVSDVLLMDEFAAFKAAVQAKDQARFTPAAHVRTREILVMRAPRKIHAVSDEEYARTAAAHGVEFCAKKKPKSRVASSAVDTDAAPRKRVKH